MQLLPEAFESQAGAKELFVTLLVGIALATVVSGVAHSH